jgi:hypothetical protein
MGVRDRTGLGWGGYIIFIISPILIWEFGKNNELQFPRFASGIGAFSVIRTFFWVSRENIFTLGVGRAFQLTNKGAGFA